MGLVLKITIKSTSCNFSGPHQPQPYYITWLTIITQSILRSFIQTASKNEVKEPCVFPLQAKENTKACMLPRGVPLLAGHLPMNCRQLTLLLQTVSRVY